MSALSEAWRDSSGSFTGATLSPKTILERWDIVRLILEAGRGTAITDEEVLSWRPIPWREITLTDVVRGAFGTPDPSSPLYFARYGTPEAS